MRPVVGRKCSMTWQQWRGRGWVTIGWGTAAVYCDYNWMQVQLQRRRQPLPFSHNLILSCVLASVPVVRESAGSLVISQPCFPSFRAVLPTGRLFDRITQKGPIKKLCGRRNLRSNYIAEFFRKWPNFVYIWLFCISLQILLKWKRFFYPIRCLLAIIANV